MPTMQEIQYRLQDKMKELQTQLLDIEQKRTMIAMVKESMDLEDIYKNLKDLLKNYSNEPTDDNANKIITNIAQAHKELSEYHTIFIRGKDILDEWDYRDLRNDYYSVSKKFYQICYDNMNTITDIMAYTPDPLIDEDL